MKPRLVIVAAVGKNGVIGDHGRVPWHIPSDLKHFRKLSMGKPMLMGAKTYRSIGRALPGRETIVLTRDQNFSAANIAVAHNLEQSLILAETAAIRLRVDEIILCGGGEVFRALLDKVDIIHLTHVDLAPKGDVFFPQLDKNIWTPSEPIALQPEAGDEAGCIFISYRRI